MISIKYLLCERLPSGIWLSRGTNTDESAGSTATLLS